MKDNLKIVITGGPGGGKTTALDLFQREFKKEVKIVPEAATMLFEYGVEKECCPDKLVLLQQSIYEMQRTLESGFRRMYPDRLLVCDRGTLDGLAYWPEHEGSFFETVGTTLEEELARYDAVIFFQTSASHGEDIKSNNPYRSEDSKAATELDQKLKSVWERHPNFHYVPNNSSFMRKIAHGLLTINFVLDTMKKA